jgi:hypothetical protein
LHACAETTFAQATSVSVKQICNGAVDSVRVSVCGATALS